MKNSKRIIAFILMGLLVFSLVACKSEEKPEDSKEEEIIENVDGEDENKEEVPEDENNEDEEEPSDVSKEEVTLFFANLDYVESGNEDLDHVLPEVREVDTLNVRPELAAVMALFEGPTDEALVNGIPEAMRLNDVKVEGDLAYVDLADQGLNGGSLEEQLTIDQLVATLTFFDNINEVQILVDGEVRDTLMGHISINTPLNAIY